MFPALLRSLRPAQWVKNSFVLAPLLFSQKLGEPRATLLALLATAIFCVVSSAIYLINDVGDREEDRKHPLKRHRPIASGELGHGVALAAAAILVAASAAVSLRWLSLNFLWLVTAYVVMNVGYSAWLKRVVILDVMLVSAGFVIRVLAGAVAIEVQESSWLILCTIFLSLFLTFSKRRHEIVYLATDATKQRSVLSHYSPTFLDQMINVVTASTVVAYALYAVTPETVERLGSYYLVYTVPLVLFGVFRYLYLMYQTDSPRNPTEAVLKDIPSLVNIVLYALVVTAVVYWI